MFLLKVLGTLSLERDEGPLPPTASQKRRLGLLAILAVAGPRGLSRERIQSYVWPESSDERSRHSLDQLLYAVRRALGTDPFLFAGHSVLLDTSVIRSDVADFEDAIRAKAWARAVSSYGGPLLDGVYLSTAAELESWIASERSKHHVNFQKSLETLARDAAASGDASGAIAWWKKLAISDPLASRVALEVIRALADAGDRPSAVQYARTFQEMVRTELGVEPDKAIEKLVVGLVPDIARPVRGNSRTLRKVVVQTPKPIGTGDFRRAHFAWWSVAVVSLMIGLVIVGLTSNASPPVARAETGHPARPAVDPQARISYLRGVNAWSERSKEGLDAAVIYFRRASELDPGYAQAYAGLADAYVLLGYSGYRPADAMFPKAKAAALQGMQLDSTLAGPHAALAHELMWERDFARSEAEYRKAISLDPTYATAHQWYAILLVMLGRVPEAVAESGRAAALDPLSLQIQNTYATFLNISGEPLAALHHLQKVVGEEPDSAWVKRNPWLLTNMSAIYAANGQYKKAIRTAELALRVDPKHPRAVTALATIYVRMGKPALAWKVFARADTSNEQYPTYRGMMYARLGDVDSAFLYFDRVEKWGIPTMIGLRNDGELAPIRKDRRYSALLRRLGLLTTQ